MYLEFLAEEETLIAVRTLERAVTGVDHAMLAQRALVDERPTTHVTRIRPLACTDIFYYLQGWPIKHGQFVLQSICFELVVILLHHFGKPLYILKFY